MDIKKIGIIAGIVIIIAVVVFFVVKKNEKPAATLTVSAPVVTVAK
jgi:hypothetical protein